MGLARLLAKGWIVVCLFAGAHALRFALQSGGDLVVVIPQVIVSVLLFAAMGLLFVGGYGASGARLHAFSVQNVMPRRLPGFNEVVFLLFVAISFLNQIVYAPLHVSGRITDMLEGALYFAVPGHAVIVDRLSWGRDGFGQTVKEFNQVFVVDSTIGGATRPITSVLSTVGDGTSGTASLDR